MRLSSVVGVPDEPLATNYNNSSCAFTCALMLPTEFQNSCDIEDSVETFASCAELRVMLWSRLLLRGFFGSCLRAERTCSMCTMPKKKCCRIKGVHLRTTKAGLAPALILLSGFSSVVVFYLWGELHVVSQINLETPQTFKARFSQRWPSPRWSSLDSIAPDTRTTRGTGVIIFQ